jgi:hypothetical protein
MTSSASPLPPASPTCSAAQLAPHQLNKHSEKITVGFYFLVDRFFAAIIFFSRNNKYPTARLPLVAGLPAAPHIALRQEGRPREGLIFHLS